MAEQKTKDIETVETVEEPKEVIEEKVFELVQVPTQHALMVQTPEGEVIQTEQLLVEIANEVRAIRKGIVG